MPLNRYQSPECIRWRTLHGLNVRRVRVVVYPTLSHQCYTVAVDPKSCAFRQTGSALPMVKRFGAWWGGGGCLRSGGHC